MSIIFTWFNLFSLAFFSIWYSLFSLELLFISLFWREKGTIFTSLVCLFFFYFYFPEMQRGMWWVNFSGTFYLFLSVIVYVTYFLIVSFPWARKRCLIWGNYQVEVEALVIQGPKLATVMNQVKKLEVTVLVLGQRRPSTLFSWSVQDSNLWYLKTVYSSSFDLWIYWIFTSNILLVGFLAASVRQATSKILLSSASTMQSAGLLV